MKKTYQISVENLQKLIDHMIYLRGQLMNVRATEGLNENIKFKIFRCVEQVRIIEEALIDERNRLPVPEGGGG